MAKLSTCGYCGAILTDISCPCDNARARARRAVERRAEALWDDDGMTYEDAAHCRYGVRLSRGFDLVDVDSENVGASDRYIVKHAREGIPLAAEERRRLHVLQGG